MSASNNDLPTVSVCYSPQQSIYLLLRDSGRRLLGAVNHPGIIRALARDRRSCVPDAVVPIPPRGDIGVGEQIAALRDFPKQQLLDQLRKMPDISPTWVSAARHPGPWMRSYAAVCWAAWQHIEPRWRAVRPRLDQETERIGIASVRGGLEAVLNSLTPRLRYSAGSFQLDGNRESLPVNGRRVVLVPGIAPAESIFVHTDEHDILAIAYPVLSLMQSVPNRTATRGRDTLSVVLGPARARLLRILDVPQSVGAIAAALHVTPSTASRHCDHLEAAGLVVRQRHGQRVAVCRTTSGDELLDVLADA